MTTYATLAQCKNYLNIASSNTIQDSLITSILNDVDSDINMKLQRFTSLPVQTEIANQIAPYEARLVALRFRRINATPQESQQMQVQLSEVETAFALFLKNNFQRSFFSQGKKSDEFPSAVDLGQSYDRQEGGGY